MLDKIGFVIVLLIVIAFSRLPLWESVAAVAFGLLVGNLIAGQIRKHNA